MMIRTGEQCTVIVNRALSQEKQQCERDAQARVRQAVTEATTKVEMLCNSKLAKCTGTGEAGSSRGGPQREGGGLVAEHRAQNLWEEERGRLVMRVTELERLIRTGECRAS